LAIITIETMPMTSCSQRFVVGEADAPVAGDALCMVPFSAVAAGKEIKSHGVAVNDLPVAAASGMLARHDARGGEQR
jgi:hypothetical protein